MRIETVIDLNAVFDSEWDTTLASMIRDEVVAAIRGEIKKAVREDKELKRVIDRVKKKAVQALIKEVGGGT